MHTLQYIQQGDLCSIILALKPARMKGAQFQTFIRITIQTALQIHIFACLYLKLIAITGILYYALYDDMQTDSFL